MCWVCEDWKEASPKTFKRWVACAQGRGNERDAAIIGSGFQIAKEQLDKVGAENILRELDKDTTAEIVFEGDLMCRDKVKSESCWIFLSGRHPLTAGH